MSCFPSTNNTCLQCGNEKMGTKLGYLVFSVLKDHVGMTVRIVYKNSSINARENPNRGFKRNLAH